MATRMTSLSQLFYFFTNHWMLLTDNYFHLWICLFLFLSTIYYHDILLKLASHLFRVFRCLYLCEHVNETDKRVNSITLKLLGEKYSFKLCKRPKSWLSNWFSGCFMEFEVNKWICIILKKDYLDFEVIICYTLVCIPN